MKAAVAQPHRPAAVEAPIAMIAASQDVAAPADVLEVSGDGLREGLEESAYRGVGVACQILGGLCPMTQGLEEERVPVGVMQAVEACRQIRQKGREIRPRGGRLDEQRQDEIPVVAEPRIALIAEEAQ